MFGPPGVDSDSSSEEDEYPSPSPKAQPKQGFFKTLLTSSKKLNEQKEKDKVDKLTPVQAAEELTTPRPPTPSRKKVRIRVEGEEHPDKLDLFDSPLSPDPPSAANAEFMGWNGPEDNLPAGFDQRPDEAASQVLDLLQKLLTQSAMTGPPGAPGALAGSNVTPPPGKASTSTTAEGQMHMPPDNRPGISGTATTGQTGDTAPKKESKLTKWTKLAVAHAPKPPPVPPSNHSPTTPLSAAPPYSSPVEAQFPGASTTPPMPPQYGHGGQYAPLPWPDQGPALPFKQASNISNNLTQAQHPQGNAQPQLPQQRYGPPQQFEPPAQLYQDPGRTPGHAQEYYNGWIQPPSPYPQYSSPIAPSQPQSAPPWSGPNAYPGSQHAWPSRWQPGQMHWDGPDLPSRSAQIQRGSANGRSPGNPLYPASTGDENQPQSALPPFGFKISFGQHYPTTAPLPSVLPPTAPPSWSHPYTSCHRHPTRHFVPYTCTHWHSSCDLPLCAGSHRPPSRHSLCGHCKASRSPRIGRAADTDQHLQEAQRGKPNPPTPPFVETHRPGIKATQGYQRQPAMMSSGALPGRSKGQTVRTSAPPKPLFIHGQSSTAAKEGGETVKSPRIVRKAADGTWQEVDPYPSSPAGPSSGKHHASRHDPEPQSSVPRRVERHQLNEQKRKEYEELLLRKAKEKARAEAAKLRDRAAEGSLTPKEVGVAVNRAAEAIYHEGRAVMDEKTQSSGRKHDLTPSHTPELQKSKEAEDKGKETQISGEATSPGMQTLTEGNVGGRDDAGDGGQPQPKIRDRTSAINAPEHGQAKPQVEAKIKGIKEKIKTGGMSKEEGKAEIKRFTKTLHDLETGDIEPSKSSAGGKDAKLTESTDAHQMGSDIAATNEPQAHKSEKLSAHQISGKDAQASSTDVQLTAIDSKIERIKRKLKEGTISKEDAKAMMKKLVQNREMLRASADPKLPRVKAQTQDEPKSVNQRAANGQAARPTPFKPHDEASAPTTAVNAQKPGKGKERAEATDAGGRNEEQKDQKLSEKAQIDQRIQEVRRRVKEGLLSKDKAQTQLERLAKAREALSSRHRSGQAKSTSSSGPEAASKVANAGGPKQDTIDIGNIATEGTETSAPTTTDFNTHTRVDSVSNDDKLMQAWIAKLDENKTRIMRYQGAIKQSEGKKLAELKQKLNKAQETRTQLKQELALIGSGKDGSQGARNVDSAKSSGVDGADGEIPSTSTARELQGFIKAKTSSIGDRDEPDPDLDQDILDEILKPDVLGGITCSLTSQTAATGAKSSAGSSTPRGPETSQKPAAHSSSAKLRRTSGAERPNPSTTATSPSRSPSRSQEDSSPSKVPPSGDSCVERPQLSDARLSRPVDPHSLSAATAASGDPSWSTALVSFATCHHLANETLSDLMANSVDDSSQPASLAAVLLPRLLTSLLLQQDLDSVLKRSLGAQSSDRIEEFMAHLNRIQLFFSRLTDGGGSSSGEVDKILRVVDHLLHLSKLVSPEMMSSLRKIPREWKQDGLTIGNVIRTVKLGREALMIHQTNSAGADRPTDVESGLMNQLLDLLDVDNDPPASSTRTKRLSLHTPRPQPASPPPTPPETHGIRHHLSSMVHSLRHSPPCNLSPHISSPQAHQWTMSTHGTPQPPSKRDNHEDRVTESTHHAHGIPMMTESLSPTSKRRVEHHLNPLRPAEVMHDEHHHERSAPDLHLPDATADFLNDSEGDVPHSLPPSRGATTTPPLKARRPNDEDISNSLAQNHTSEDSVTLPRELDSPQGSQNNNRRPSAWSSDSNYSVSSYETEGTIDSDDEARDLLAHADSGPKNVRHAEDESPPTSPAPSEGEVERARKVLKK